MALLPPTLFFSDPSPPLGLRVSISWDPAQNNFDPIELWLGIVAAGSTLAQSPSGQRMTRAETFRLVVSHAQFRVMPISNEYCTIDAMVWGLWDLGNQMAQLYPMPRRVPLFSSQIWTSRGWLGSIGVSRPVPGIQDPDDSIAAVRERRVARSASLSSYSTPSLIKRVDSGSIPCREDRDLVVEYQFLYVDLDPGQVFTAFLRSNTFFATYNMHDKDVTMVAYGSGYRISLGVTDVKEGPGMEQLTWGLARIAIKTLWREVVLSFKAEEGRFVDRPRFEKLRFVLIYKGMRIGLGLLG
ncbi:MAG: hypothetical protein Q9195_002563 [Heterodermia aff. obscurata]